MMNLNDYQEAAEKFAQFPQRYAMSYTALGLVNEAGEYAGKIKKLLRGDFDLNYDIEGELAKELGDVLWYLAACASVINRDLESIAKGNLAKLEDRAARGVIKGNGDNR